jgi:hypothetical protein
MGIVQHAQIEGRRGARGKKGEITTQLAKVMQKSEKNSKKTRA